MHTHTNTVWQSGGRRLECVCVTHMSHTLGGVWLQVMLLVYVMFNMYIYYLLTFNNSIET